MDRAHDEYLRTKARALEAGAKLASELEVDADKIAPTRDNVTVVDLCQPERQDRASHRSASLPIPRIALATALPPPAAIPA